MRGVFPCAVNCNSGCNKNPSYLLSLLATPGGWGYQSYCMAASSTTRIGSAPVPYWQVQVRSSQSSVKGGLRSRFLPEIINAGAPTSTIPAERNGSGNTLEDHGRSFYRFSWRDVACFGHACKADAPSCAKPYRVALPLSCTVTLHNAVPVQTSLRLESRRGIIVFIGSRQQAQGLC